MIQETCDISRFDLKLSFRLDSLQYLGNRDTAVLLNFRFDIETSFLHQPLFVLQMVQPCTSTGLKLSTT